MNDQKAAYEGMQQQLIFFAGRRLLIALARALAAPLVFGVIPLGILNWKHLSWTLRMMVIATAISSLIFSGLRGTDLEFADLFIVSGSAMLIVLARGARVARSGPGVRRTAPGALRRYWLPALGFLLFVYIAQGMFIERKEARMGSADSVCAVGTGICADLDAPMISWLDRGAQFGVSEFVMIISQGYYGLALAMEKDFRPAWGLGHSPTLMSLYVLLTKDETLADNTYTFRNGADGWDERYYWSSLITWIANDVGFPGALAVLALIGFVWGRAWRDAVLGENDRAAVMFCVFMIMLFYLPANDKVLGVFDGYTTILFWMTAWSLSLRGGGGRR